jgi:hypothetical protein
VTSSLVLSLTGGSGSLSESVSLIPLPAGCAESFAADVEVEARWPGGRGAGAAGHGEGGPGERVWRGRLRGCALEFGGDYAGRGGSVLA